MVFGLMMCVNTVPDGDSELRSKANHQQHVNAVWQVGSHSRLTFQLHLRLCDHKAALPQTKPTFRADSSPGDQKAHLSIQTKCDWKGPVAFDEPVGVFF